MKEINNLSELKEGDKIAVIFTVEETKKREVVDCVIVRKGHDSILGDIAIVDEWMVEEEYDELAIALIFQIHKGTFGYCQTIYMYELDDKDIMPIYKADAIHSEVVLLEKDEDLINLKRIETL